eukprot:scaffold4902_cov377-Prasinococcus_capsulatus_cf.AAC.2
MPVVNRGVVCESNFRLVSLFEPAGLRQCISRGDYIPDIDVNQVRHEDVASGRTVIKVLLDVEGSEAQIATRSALPGKSCGERETSSTFTKALEQLESLAQSYGVPLQLTSGQQHRSHGRIRDVSWHCSKRRQLAVLDGDCCLVYGMDSLSTNLERMTTANIAWEGLLAARNRPADGQVQGSPALRQLVARLSDTARTVLTRLEAERSNVAQYTNDLFSSGSEHNVVETSLLEEMEQALTDVAVLTGQSLREDALARLEGTLTSALSATLHAPRPLALTHEYQRSCDAVAWRPLLPLFRLLTRVAVAPGVGHARRGMPGWGVLVDHISRERQRKCRRCPDRGYDARCVLPCSPCVTSVMSYSVQEAYPLMGCEPGGLVRAGSSAQQHGRASVIIPTAWARFLPTTTRITSISWNPLGHALAAASVDHSTVWLWEIATGKETLLRRALGGVSSLLWSPAGDKLLVTHLNAAFTLWESSSWQSDRWKYGNVRAAAWAPKVGV